MIVPRAQLKVFSPLDTFPPRDRERWAAYAREGRGLTRREVADVEEAYALAGLVAGVPRPVGELALVRRAGRRVLVCPLDLDLRTSVAFDEFRRRVPAEVLPAFVPDPGMLAVLEVGSARRAPHVRDEAWAVPLHWFVAFDPSERRFTDPVEGAGPRVVHLTTIEQAVARVEHVSEVVETTIEDGEEVLVELADLAAWLETFPASAVLELDYGRVAATFTRAELAADRTCADLWEAVEALEQGDALGAAAAYGTARARWRGRRAAEHAS